MKTKLLIAFGATIVAFILAFDGHSLMPQQSTPSTKSDSIKDLTQQIDDLKLHVHVLEMHQNDLEQRLAKVESPQYSSALSEADSELAKFDCEYDFNKAYALALAQGTPGYTLTGAAAMTCTQRLAKLTEKAIRSIESR